jgi:hypothetical protein
LQPEGLGSRDGGDCLEGSSGKHGSCPLALGQPQEVAVLYPGDHIDCGCRAGRTLREEVAVQIKLQGCTAVPVRHRGTDLGSWSHWSISTCQAPVGLVDARLWSVVGHTLSFFPKANLDKGPISHPDFTILTEPGHRYRDSNENPTTLQNDSNRAVYCVRDGRGQPLFSPQRGRMIRT